MVVNMSDLLGYARLSTIEQDAALEDDALKAAGCIKVFTDKASGAVERRPQLDRLLDQLRPPDDDLNGRGVHLRSSTEGFDTATPGGRLLSTTLDAVAEMERSLIVERTKAGLDAARARGRKGGRPSVMPAERIAGTRRRCDEREFSLERIVATIGVSRSSSVRVLAVVAA